MDRRGFIKYCALLGTIVHLRSWFTAGRALAAVVAIPSVREVLPGDEAALVELMRSCVADGDSFHGACQAMEWTDNWAKSVITDASRSVVLTINSSVIGFFALPSSPPKQRTGVPITYQKAFWCGAAGLRSDVLGRVQSEEVFRQMLHVAFSRAMDLGYEYVRAAAPWQQHPFLPKRFEDYPGLHVQAFGDEEGQRRYLLQWRLADAVQALEAPQT